jgi:hypothetical protein
MFLGHYAIGLAAKKADRKPSLATYFVAVLLLDLLWPFFLIMGIEKVEVDPGNTEFTPLNFVSYPYSHSLLAVLIWSVLAAVVYYVLKKSTRSALLIGALVASHWLLDFLTHRPDLPLAFSGDHKVGLGLWNEKLATILVELALFFGGIVLYTRATKPNNKTGKIAFWSLVVFLLVIYFLNAYGPTPTAEAIPYGGFAQWLFVVWAFWIERNRSAVDY